MGERLIFQLGTNNWQRDGEFAPGSGILHESHHRAFNSLPGVRAYSLYPSRRQRFREELVRVFELEHDIPIAESVSPVSSYRWHAMSHAEVDAYRARLVDEVFTWTTDVEDATGEEFGLFIAHHGFMNPLVMRDVNRLRAARGRSRVPILCFVHGTELKMFRQELATGNDEEYPLRFLPLMRKEGIFDPRVAPGDGVDVVAAISTEQVEAFAEVFPTFPTDRVVLSPNGYNERAFRVLPEVGADRDAALAEFRTQPYAGSAVPTRPVASPTGFDAVVTFCGKFAAWKRLDVLLHAAAQWEQDELEIATVVVGSGPLADQQRYQDLAEELGLRRTFFVGPRDQPELAVLFNAADVACFPAHQEPFGLVFIEAMACGTPVVGADSGGPRDFVTPEVGVLVPETDDPAALADSVAAAVRRAVAEDWKSTKGPAAATYARERFSVVRQVEDLLAAMDRLLA